MFQLRALQADVDGLGLRGLELGLRRGDVGAGVDALRVAVLRHFQGAHVVRDDPRVQPLLRVRDAQGKVSLRQCGVKTEADRFQIRRTGLLFRPAGFRAAAHPAPDIKLPSRRQTGAERIAQRGGGGPARRRPRPTGRTVGGD